MPRLRLGKNQPPGQSSFNSRRKNSVIKTICKKSLFQAKTMKLLPIWLLCVAMMQAVTSGAQPVTKIAARGVHSLFLKSDGSLWVMGNNGNGQLGDGSTDNGNFYTNRPEQIVATNVATISARGNNSLLA